MSAPALTVRQIKALGAEINCDRSATALAKRFSLLNKADRIALFKAVLYGVSADNLAT